MMRFACHPSKSRCPNYVRLPGWHTTQTSRCQSHDVLTPTPLVMGRDDRKEGPPTAHIVAGPLIATSRVSASLPPPPSIQVRASAATGTFLFVLAQESWKHRDFWLASATRIFQVSGRLHLVSACGLRPPTASLPCLPSPCVWLPALTATITFSNSRNTRADPVIIRKVSRFVPITAEL